MRSLRTALDLIGAMSETALDKAAFARLGVEKHSLVRFHAYEGGRVTQRISDSLSAVAFRRSALYADYYRRVRIDHAMALPVYVGTGVLVSFVLNVRGAISPIASEHCSKCCARTSCAPIRESIRA